MSRLNCHNNANGVQTLQRLLDETVEHVDRNTLDTIAETTRDQCDQTSLRMAKLPR